MCETGGNRGGCEKVKWWHTPGQWENNMQKKQQRYLQNNRPDRHPTVAWMVAEMSSWVIWWGGTRPLFWQLRCSDSRGSDSDLCLHLIWASSDGSGSFVFLFSSSLFLFSYASAGIMHSVLPIDCHLSVVSLIFKIYWLRPWLDCSVEQSASPLSRNIIPSSHPMIKLNCSQGKKQRLRKVDWQKGHDNLCLNVWHTEWQMCWKVLIKRLETFCTFRQEGSFSFLFFFFNVFSSLEPLWNM